MRYLKLTVGLGLIIIGLLFLASMLLPRKISIVKSVDLTGNKECAGKMVQQFANWQKWFPAIKDGSSSINIISDQEAEMTNASGKKQHVQLFQNDAESFGFQLSAGSASPADFTFFIQSDKDGGMHLNLVVNTALSWYPWDRLKGVFMDKIAGPQYQLALDNIIKACKEE